MRSPNPTPDALEWIERFPGRLYDMRTAAKLTQQELADLCPTVTIRAISKYERSCQLPSIPSAVQLAAALGVSLDELVGWR